MEQRKSPLEPILLSMRPNSMRKLLIVSTRRNLPADLIRREPLPAGISFEAFQTPEERAEQGTHAFLMQVDTRRFTPLAFSLWILRRLCSTEGDHHLEISGRRIPSSLPDAIDAVASALQGKARRRTKAAA